MAKEDFTAEDDPETQQAIEGAATSEFQRLVDRLKQTATDRRCKDCGLVKSLTEFYKAHGDYHQPRCKKCHHIRTKRWYKEHPEAQKKTDRECQLKRKYGITTADYDQLLLKQNFACAICLVRPNPTDKRLAVDHCHSTGKVRGLLCSCCNTALGKFREDPELLRKGALYVENNKS